MAYTVGPGKKKKPKPPSKDILSHFEEGALGKVPIVKDAIKAVRAYNKNTKAKEDIYKKVNNR
jgi:hypothetical protein